MKWFDPQAALAEIQGAKNTEKQPTPATLATPATEHNQSGNNRPHVAEVAVVAAHRPKTEKTAHDPEARILAAIDIGNDPFQKWQSRHGAIASHGDLGVTVTYRLIDRLLQAGRIAQRKDGTLYTIGELL